MNAFKTSAFVASVVLLLGLGACGDMSYQQKDTAISGLAQGADTQIAETAQNALSGQMGEAAKDLQVQVIHGDAKLSGWVNGPKDVMLAAYIVSTVPGVVHSYSSGVHTWIATDQN